jgi:hypothetical protein
MPAVTERAILGASSTVVIERDAWDWLLYAATALAAITAIVVFSAWALELRRRPEVQFYWRLSPDGDPANLAEWPADHVPEISATQPFLVAAAIQNTGDKAGGDTLINFVVPDCFDLHQVEAPEVEPVRAGNETAGLPPDNRVVFLIPRATLWTPANWHLSHYRLQCVAGQGDRPLPVRLLFAVADSRFNSRGWRWLPSVVPPSGSEVAPVGTPWPPVPAKRRTARWLRAEPRGRVACWRGERSDVRDLIVLPAEGPHAATPTRAEGWRERFHPRWLRPKRS